jgi:phosphatidylinositol kinase/protein kinase (PI-3  family)
VIGEIIPLSYGTKGNTNTGIVQRSMLLYKHDEDMRQEMLAVQFIATCDKILKASGLDLKIKTYGCIPVGNKKGFIEWVPGALSLSELCKSNQTNGEDSTSRLFSSDLDTSTDGPDASPAFQRCGGWCNYESLRSLRQHSRSSKLHGIGISGDNPLQEFLRSNAYDSAAPYFIKKDVMDTYVKSCAGYCVITYLLGVGDRHTDNLLLHSQGYFFHCDYSFILGQDPKTYLPMRITTQMLDAMGGKDSDNFAKFLSLVGAAFVTLRQPSSVRILISLLKGMIDAKIPDISRNQKPESAIQLFYERLCLDLNDNDAVLFLEENIARSSTSKLWVAVDALHSLGKRF